MSEDLYDACVKAGLEIDSLESDLYIRATPVALDLIRKSKLPYSPFNSQIDGQLWYDVPFAYLPWWREKTRCRSST